MAKTQTKTSTLKAQTQAKTSAHKAKTQTKTSTLKAKTKAKNGMPGLKEALRPRPRSRLNITGHL